MTSKPASTSPSPHVESALRPLVQLNDHALFKTLSAGVREKIYE
jgi:hypothetical protein